MIRERMLNLDIGGIIYMPITLHTNQMNIRKDGVFTSFDTVSDKPIADRIAEIKSSISTQQELEDMIAETFSTSTNYSIGDYVIYHNTTNNTNELYRFKVEHTAGSWDKNHVTKVELADELQEQLDDKATIIQELVTGEIPLPPLDETLETPMPYGAKEGLLYITQANFGKINTTSTTTGKKGFCLFNIPIPANASIYFINSGYSGGTSYGAWVTDKKISISNNAATDSTSIIQTLYIFNNRIQTLSENAKYISICGYKANYADYHVYILPNNPHTISTEVEQTLTDTQKTMARNNISAADITSENLFNAATCTDNKAYNYNGAEVLNLNDYSVSAPIPVIPGYKIKISPTLDASTIYTYIFQNAHTNLIKACYNRPENSIITVPDTAKYLICTLKTSDKDKFSVTYIDKAEQLEQDNQNIQKGAAAFQPLANIITIDQTDEKFENNKWLRVSAASTDPDGDVRNQTGYFVSGFIPIYPYYKLKFNWNLSGTENYGHAFFFERENADGTMERRMFTTEEGRIVSKSSNRIITVPEGAKYLRVTGLLADIDTYQIEQYTPAQYDIISKIDNNIANIENTKQNVLSFDSTPIEESINPVTSDGIFKITNFLNNGVEELNLENYTKVPYSISGSNTILRSTSQPYESYYIPIKSNWKKIIVTAANNNTYITFFKTLISQSIAKDTDISNDLATGEDSRRQILKRTEQEYIIPSDAQLLIVYNYSTSSDGTVNNLAPTKLQVCTNTYNHPLNSNPYKRFTIKNPGSLLMDEYYHCAFPSMCYFGGREVIAYRAGYSHLTPTDTTNWGGIAIDTRDEDGTYIHQKVLKTSDFDGMQGELRDPQLGITRDGQYLIIAAFTTYTLNEEDTHENVLICLNINLEVVDYNIVPNVSTIYWGNPLFTPQGHLIIAGYGGGQVYLYRSTTAFSAGVSTLTIEKTSEDALINKNTSSEACIGYFNNYLVMLVRRGPVTDNSLFSCTIRTENLEGTDGWTSPKAIPQIIIHAPKILPYSKGDYLLFSGAIYIDSTNRYPGIGLLDFTTSPSTLVALANVDPTLPTNYGGYSGIVPRGGNEYDIVYYQEGERDLGNPHHTGLYFKRVNLNALLPGSAYFLS